ncbi:MAG: lamin tail domain-containing protein [Opitutales bacterium]
MSLILKCCFPLFAGLAFAVSSLNGAIVITEILYNASGADGSQEWVEIYNSGSSTVDVTGWKLNDEDANAGDWGTLSGSLAPGEVGIITEVPETDFKSAWSTAATATIFSLGIGNWGNLANGSPGSTNETLHIVDDLGNPVDWANYENPGGNSSTDWPDSANGESIYVLAGFFDQTSNDDGSNWALSSVGTDGAVTSTATANFEAGNIGSPGVVATAIPEAETSGLFLGLVVSAGLLYRRRRTRA